MSLFSALYAPVRSLLGDIALIPMYSNAQIDMGISMAILLDGMDTNGIYPKPVGNIYSASGQATEGFAGGTEYNEGPVDPINGRTLAPDLQNKTDTLRLSLRAAISLLAPQAGKFSYKTKVLSIQRENGANGQLGFLQGLLFEVINGQYVVQSESEWDCFVRGSIAAVSKLNRFPQLPG